MKYDITKRQNLHSKRFRSELGDVMDDDEGSKERPSLQRRKLSPSIQTAQKSQSATSTKSNRVGLKRINKSSVERRPLQSVPVVGKK